MKTDEINDVLDTFISGGIAILIIMVLGCVVGAIALLFALLLPWWAQLVAFFVGSYYVGKIVRKYE